MLAIKECLIREGVLNLNANENIQTSKSATNLDALNYTKPPYSNNNNNNNNNSSSNYINWQLSKSNTITNNNISNMDALRYRKHQSDLSITKAASSDLSSASATAKTSCQQQYKQQQPQQHQQREEKTKKTEQKTYDKAKKIYSGHHPHFHHHTAPVYYTDVNLRIHTPNSADVAALNENYQSVYSTPSKLVGGEHYFPKTTTATVAPPPIGSTTATTTTTASAPTLAAAASDSNSDNNKSTSSTTAATRAAFFRGDTAVAAIAKNRDESQRNRRNLERYIQSMPSFANPTKGTEQVFVELQQEQQQQPQDTQEVNKASLVFACTNFKPTTAATTTSAAVNISPTVDYPSNYSTNVALRSSRNPQRFNNRKRAVRVRSESRPISALYDIICKEKGLDIGTTTTNDEDSSSSSPVRQYSHGDVDVLEQQQHQQQQYNIGSYRQPSQLHSLSAMSSSLGSPSFKGQPMSSSYETMPGQHQQQQQQQTQHQQLLSSSSVSGSTSASKRTKAMRRKQRPQAGQRARSADNDKNDDADGDGDDDDDDDGVGIGDDDGLGGNNADEHISTAVVGSNNADVVMTSSQMRQSAQHSKAASLPPMLAKHTHQQQHSHQQQQQQPKHFTQAISSTSADIISEPTEQIINQTDSEQQLRLTSNANGRDNVVMAAGTANNHKNLSASMLQLKMSPTTPSSSSLSANTTVKSRKLDKRYHTADGALLNTNNKSDHQQQQYHHDHYYHAAADDDHDDANDDNGGNEASSSSAASFAPQANSQSNAELLTNGAITASAKRFITRSSRAASRQSVNGQNYHSDSTTPSPTRQQQQQQQQQEQQQATHKSKGGCQSSPVNGNSSASASASAYETAATTVMTHSTPTPPVQTVPIHPPPPTAAAATTTAIETTESAAAAATASSTAANAAGSAATSGISAAAACCTNTKSNTFTPTVPTTITATTTITITTTTALKNSQRQMLNKCNSNHCNNNNNHNYNNNAATTPLPLMPPLTTSITVLKPTSPKHHCITTTTATAIATTSPKRRKNPLSPLRICQQQQQQQQQLSLQQQQQQQSQPNSPQSPLFAVRTTKTTRLRAAALDKKKEEELQQQLQQQQRYSSPTSPRQPTTPTTRRASSCSDTQKSPSVDTTEATTTKRCVSASVVPNTVAAANTVPASEATASAKSRLVLTVSGLAMKQNLSEMHFTSGGGGGTPTTPTSPGGKAPQQQQQQVRTIHSDDCTVKLSPKRQQRDLGMRPRSSTMHKNTDESTTATMLPLTTIELSPVQKRQTPESSPRRNGTDRDKSAKRKSNLNRSLNEEATQDGDDSLASRRRRRRELGMARTLVPNDDVALRELLQGNSPKKSAATTTAATNEPTAKSSPTRSDLAMHMENARRGLDLLTTNAESERRRAQTASPKRESYRTTTAIVSPPKTPNGSNTGVANNISARVSRRSDTLPLSAMRRLRSDDVNNKLNERTKSDLAEIMKIAEQANLAAGAIDVQKTPVEREAGGHEAVLKLSPILRRKSTDEANTGIGGVAASMSSNASPPAHNQIVSILKKKDHGLGESTSSASSNASPVTFSANVVDTPTKQKRAGILKKRSSLDESRYYSRSHSPDERSILIKSARRNSLEETGGIVAGGSVGQMSLQQQQHGILKQSSYDSSKSDGCPSATESQPQSILKKKDSTSTPSDGGTHAPKHVSISQAVILAAAELGRCDAGEVEHHANEIGAGTDSYVTPNNEEYEIRPILKQESTSSEEYTRPKPILKKKSSGDSDEHEIRPILKTSRKSSREEFDVSGGALSGDSGEGGATVRPILKTDSPSKRRSLGAADATLLESVNAAGGTSSPAAILATATQGLLKRRTRSLERQDGAPIIDLAAALNAISSSQSQSPAPQPLDFSAAPASVSVAERIRNMEMFLSNQTSPTTPTATTMCSTVNSSWESPLQAGESTGHTPAAAGIARPKVFKPSVIRRDLYRERFKTQPVTNEEMCFFKATSSPFDISSTSSAFRPTKPLDFGQQHSQSTQHIHQLNEAGPLISPIVGSAAFFHLNNTPDGGGAVGGSIGFKLARSQTQPVQSSTRSLNTGSTPISSSSSSGSSKQQQQLFSDADSERIFDMSGLDEDSTMQSIGGDDASAAATSTTTPSAKTSGAGVSRSSSVRARANMFQQLQEQTLGVRETAGGARPQATGTTTTATRHSPPPDDDDDPKTPNTTQDDDEEVDPSSLSLAERLAFFSSLSGGAGGKGGANHSRRLQRSRTSSYTRSSPPYASMERSTSIISNSSVLVSNNDNNDNNSSQLPTTPRSSTTTSGSSASITPTSTMDCSPILPAELREASTTTPNEQRQRQRQSSGSEQSLVDSTATTATPTTLTSTTLDLTDSMMMTAKEEAQLLDEVDEDWVLIEKETEQQPESMQHLQTDVPEAETETNNYVRVRRASLATTESASTETLTPENVNVLTPTTKRIKLRTVGKLVMPQKFLSSSNNHNNSNNSNHNNNDRNNNVSLMCKDNVMITSVDNTTKDWIEVSMRKIGKIKSPFIEQQQQQQQQKLRQHNFSKKKSDSSNSISEENESIADMVTSRALRTHNHSGNSGGASSNISSSSDEANISPAEDSGKENYDVRKQAGSSGGTTATGAAEPTSPPMVVELRKKLTRLVNAVGNATEQPPVTRRCATRNNSNRSSSSIDERFAKFFGLKEPTAAAPLTKTQSMPPLSSNNGNSSFKATNGNQTMSLKASPSADDDNDDAFVAAAVADSKSPAVAPAASTPVAAINTNVRLANSSTPAVAAAEAAPGAGIATITITTPVSAYKRRDPLKRPRAMSIQTDSAKKVIGLSRGGTGTPRARPVTLTDGMRLPAFPVSCYEDLVVTKEEFETAALEFERLFSGASA